MMKLYIWRHYRKFHSHSMIDEPVIHEDMYGLAEIVVIASTEEEALEKICQEAPQFRIEDLKKLKPEIRGIKPGVLYQRIE